MTVSASWDIELMRRFALELAREFGDRGQLGPGLNVARFAWNGRLGEYISGEDPFFGAQMARATVSALRSLDRPPLQVAKHFIPNSIENGRRGIIEVVDERTLFEVYYPPFAAAIDAGVSAVMCAYNAIRCTSGVCSGMDAYSCANDDVLNKHLKTIMEFKGIVMSDWDATRCHGDAAKSLGCPGSGQYIDEGTLSSAGLDLEMPTCKAFKNGVTQRASEKAVRMNWAYLVQGRKFSDPESPGATPQHGLKRTADTQDLCAFSNSSCKRELSVRIIVESTVVLKNDGVLPLSKQASIALVGREACAAKPVAHSLGSAWFGPCSNLPNVNVHEGIVALRGSKDITCPDERGYNDAADSADVVLVAVAAPVSREGHDRESLQLAQEDVDVIKYYTTKGRKVVVTMNSPGPMITSTWDHAVAALLVTWLPWHENGHGIAKALYNDGLAAAGRLPFTFPKCITSSCSILDERKSVLLGEQVETKSYTVFSEKALIGYRWYHAHDREVSYPFGFGLFAYGTSEIEYSNAVPAARTEGVAIACSMKLKCRLSACLEGHEVPQLYVSFPLSVPGERNSKPEWMLKGFKKVHIGRGSPRQVEFMLSERDLSYWDDRPGFSRWVCAGGVYRACVGANARDAIVESKGACTEFTYGCSGVVTPASQVQELFDGVPALGNVAARGRSFDTASELCKTAATSAVCTFSLASLFWVVLRLRRRIWRNSYSCMQEELDDGDLALVQRGDLANSNTP
eukprot:TRINITY_DN8764_c1_g6_i1.p1 TRINITY_DN8764_c1_g6~~TRINITY_DN8764_c1_g6_i1.p1  ORF type:complete len:849 (-),score=102.33 TRINITY_DN8764_c1_g6_i1:50-2275(-)